MTIWLMVFHAVFSGNNFANDSIDRIRISPPDDNSDAHEQEQEQHQQQPHHQQPQSDPQSQSQSQSQQINYSHQLSDSMNNTPSPGLINIPTTIDGLIEYIAKNGDDFEGRILSEIAQINERTLFR